MTLYNFLQTTQMDNTHVKVSCNNIVILSHKWILYFNNKIKKINIDNDNVIIEVL